MCIFFPSIQLKLSFQSGSGWTPNEIQVFPGTNTSVFCLFSHKILSYLSIPDLTFHCSGGFCAFVWPCTICWLFFTARMKWSYATIHALPHQDEEANLTKFPSTLSRDRSEEDSFSWVLCSGQKQISANSRPANTQFISPRATHSFVSFCSVMAPLVAEYDRHMDQMAEQMEKYEVNEPLKFLFADMTN